MDKAIVGITITFIVGAFATLIAFVIMAFQSQGLINPDDCQTVRTTVIYQDNKEVKTFDYLDCKEK